MRSTAVVLCLAALLAGASLVSAAQALTTHDPKAVAGSALPCVGDDHFFLGDDLWSAWCDVAGQFGVSWGHFAKDLGGAQHTCCNGGAERASGISLASYQYDEHEYPPCEGPYHSPACGTSPPPVLSCTVVAVIDGIPIYGCTHEGTILDPKQAGGTVIATLQPMVDAALLGKTHDQAAAAMVTETEAYLRANPATGKDCRPGRSRCLLQMRIHGGGPCQSDDRNPACREMASFGECRPLEGFPGFYGCWHVAEPRSRREDAAIREALAKFKERHNF